VILTFFLVSTILHTTVDGKSGAVSGWVIGMTYAIAVLVGAPFTGASLNPARTFGPALFSKPDITNVYTYVIYFLGPLLGATFAVFLFKYFTKTEDEFYDDEIVVEDVEFVEEEVIPVKAKKPAARKKTQKES
jgi:aquaporin Z